MPIRKTDIKKIIDKISEEHMYPVPPNPIATRLDKIIELLEELIFETRAWIKEEHMEKPEIFSGKNSVKMWNEINKAKTIRDLRYALYGICCKLQELESQIEKYRRNKWKNIVQSLYTLFQKNMIKKFRIDKKITELTNANGRQAWIYLEPKINQFVEGGRMIIKIKLKWLEKYLPKILYEKILIWYLVKKSNKFMKKWGYQEGINEK